MDYSIVSRNETDIGYAYRVLIKIECRNAGRRTWISPEVPTREPTAFEALYFDLITGCDPSWDQKRTAPGWISEEFLLPKNYCDILRAGIASLPDGRKTYVLARYEIGERDDGGSRRSLRAAGGLLGVSQEAVRLKIQRILPELYAFVILAEKRPDATIRALPKRIASVFAKAFHDDAAPLSRIAEMTRAELLAIPDISLYRLSEVEDVLRCCGLQVRE